MTADERDAHLREALRHAPDAQVQAPAALSAFILNEAHAKARDASAPVRPSRRNPFATLWDWLARPSVATGFAGVMAATLVGMMWWGQPMDEAAMPRPPVPAAAPALPPAVPPPVAPPVVAQAPAVEAERAASPVPRVALRKPAAEADQAEKKAAPLPAAKAEAPLPAETRTEAAPVAREAVVPAAPTPAMAPPPAGAAADSAAATATAGALAKSKSADEPKRLRSMAGVPANLNELRQQRADTEAHTSLASLRAAIAAEPARWAWQRDGGAVQDMSDAVYAWLAQLDNAAGATWRPRVARETAVSLGRELRLLRDGRVVHSLRLTERGVLWERGQSSWQAELPLATVQALEATAP